MKKETLYLKILGLGLLLTQCQTKETVPPIVLPNPNYQAIPYSNDDLTIEKISSNCPANLYQIAFFDEKNGCGLSNRTIYTTRDGGKNWNTVYDPAGKCISFSTLVKQDSVTILASGIANTCGTTAEQASILIKSVNKGSNWELIHLTPNSKDLSIACDEQKNIFAIDQLYTIDTPLSGNPQYRTKFLKWDAPRQRWDSTLMNGYWSYVRYGSQGRWWIGGSQLAETRDSSRTWKIIDNIFNQSYTSAFKNGVGYFSMLHNLNYGFDLYKTVDNGLSWNQVTSFKSFTSRIRMVSESTIFLFGEGQLIIPSTGVLTNLDYRNPSSLAEHGGFRYTLDGGQTWKEVEFFENHCFVANSFYDDKNGYVATDGSQLYKITLKR